MRPSCKFVCIRAVFLLFCVSFTLRVSADTQTLDLGEIVVTPVMVQRASENLSSSVSVVSGEEIDNSNVSTATDILGRLPGVFIHKTGKFGRADVAIRGLGSRGRRVMVLVDGKPVKVGLFGCTVTNELSADNVERIEVVRGSSSLLYGSDALGGVVNIITKKPEKETEGDLSVSYGSFDTQKYRFRQGGKIGRFGYYVTYGKINSRGYIPNSYYDHDSVSLYSEYQIGDNWQVSLNSRYFDGFNQVPAPSEPGTWKQYRRYSNALTIEGSLGRLHNKLLVYRNRGHNKFSDGWDAKDSSTGIVAHSEFSPFNSNSLLVGAEFREQAGKIYSDGFIYNPGEFDKNEFAFFFKDEQVLFADKLILDTGVRYNEDSYFGGAVIPSWGAVWHILKNTSLRASVSRGFRAPQLNELKFYSFANPGLKPEKSWNYEAGISQKFTDKLEADFVYFLIEAENFIRNSGGSFENVRSLDLRGFETSLKYRVDQSLSVSASFSKLDSGVYTAGRPENKFNMAVQYKKDKLGIFADLEYVDNYFAADNKKEAIPNYCVVDIKSTYAVSKNIEFFFGIDNLFNSEHKIYADLPGTSAGVYNQPGRWYSAGVDFKW